MIPEIGLIIAFYTITRYLSFLLRRGPGPQPLAVKILSNIFLVLTIFIAFDLLMRALSPTPTPPFPTR